MGGLNGWVVVGESLRRTSNKGHYDLSHRGSALGDAHPTNVSKTDNLTEGVEIAQLTVFKDYWRGNLDTNLENTELVSSKVFLEISDNTGSQGGQ